MQLPLSEELNIGCLSRLFDNTTNCYKFFWFQAILRKLDKNTNRFTFNELIDEMIADAWYPCMISMVMWTCLMRRYRWIILFPGSMWLMMNSGTCIRQPNLLIAARAICSRNGISILANWGRWNTGHISCAANMTSFQRNLINAHCII